MKITNKSNSNNPKSLKSLPSGACQLFNDGLEVIATENTGHDGKSVDLAASKQIIQIRVDGRALGDSAGGNSGGNNSGTPLETLK